MESIPATWFSRRLGRSVRNLLTARLDGSKDNADEDDDTNDAALYENPDDVKLRAEQ
jgi:hypothetical protein